jgi:antirestriction protein ArdC
MSKKEQSYAIEKVVRWVLERWEEGDMPPWRKPWTPPPWPSTPNNPISGKPYTGANAVLLHLAGTAYDSPLFATFNQIKEQGGSVRKGEHGFPILVYKEWTPKGGKTSESQPDPDAEQEQQAQRRGFLRMYTVFNLTQTEGLEKLLEPAAPPATWDHAVAGRMFLDHLQELGIRVERSLGDRAYCRPDTQRIIMPSEGRFRTPSAYYATLLHEAIHSTKTLTNRQEWYAAKGMNENQAYAAEELVAELGMMLLARRLNVPIAPQDAEQSASYLQGWILRTAVENYPKILHQTARLAQNAVDHLASPEFVRELERQQVTRPQQQRKDTPAPTRAPDPTPERAPATPAPRGRHR